MKLPTQPRPFTHPMGALMLLVLTLLMAGVASAADFTVRTINDEFAYTINGTGGNPPLTLVRGQTYSFDVSTCVCHPFQILNTDGSLLAGNVVTNNNISSGTVVFAVPLTAINYKYRCSVHLFGSTITTIEPPTSVTGQAANVGGTSATLNASINPNGAATTAFFIYGTDPALQTGTTSTTGQVIGSGSSAVAVTAAITGLQPVTTYYYQAQATNSAGTTQGSILSFTTPSMDASLSGLTVSQGAMNSSFDPGTLAYAILLAYPVTSLTVTPAATESHATIKVNGTTVTSGAASNAVSLSVGSNVITVLVTAQDGVTTESYTVTVTRAAFNNTDYTFGTNGQAVTNAAIFAQARGVVIQPDGKIIAVGTGLVNNSLDFIVARFNPDGSLDTTFQSTGKVSTDLGGLDDEAQSVALQADGKIVVAGYTDVISSHDQFALVRYNTDGSLDTTFNTTGKLIPSFGTSYERAAAVAVQKDGRIIVVGSVTVGSKSAMAVARFNSDGSPDTTFNSTGQLIVPAGTDSATGTSVAVQPDGAIVVGGSSVPSAGSGRFALWRFLADGTADTTLGGSGEVTTGVGSFGASAAGMALQKDGKILLAGSAIVNSSGNIAVVRYNGDGSLDTTFNTTGKVTTQVNGAASTASSVVVQADGKIAVAGTAALGGGDDIALVRFNADGSLDTTFNTTGWVTTDLGGLDYGQGLALQRDGKLVVVGKSGLGNYDFAVLRYNSGLTVAPFAWGNNSYGQLGDDQPGTTGLSPVAVQLTGALAGKTVVSVAPGIFHTVALCSDGTVACWGSNDSGELGNNNAPTRSAIPVPVDTGVNSALHNKTVIAIAAGSSHSLALCSDGTVAAWGAGGYGQLGNTQGTDSPIPVAMYAGAGSAIHGKTVVAMAGGHYHTYLLCSDGTVCGCGHNFGGQIGTGAPSPIFVTFPTAVTTSGGSALAGKKVVAIATGLYHGLALCSDGGIVGWGRDAEGELGDGSSAGSVYTPVAMNMTTGLLAGKTVVGMAAGGLHSLVLCTDGTIAAFGSNSAGQLGNGASGWNPVTTAVAVDTSGVLFGKKVVSLIAGTNNSFALCFDGTIASWGDNTGGELGAGSSSTESHVPVLVDTAPLAAAGARFTALASGPDAFHETAMVVLPPAPKLVVLNGTGIAGTQRSNNGAFSFADTSVSSSSPQTFTIENAGSADLTGLAVTKSGGNAGDFALAIGGVPGTLAAGASATFTVSFSPTAVGVRSTVVQIASSDASASPFSIQVTGMDPSSDANLSSLVPDSGTLTPVFDSATTSYVATLAGGTTSLSLTPTVAQAGSTVTINGIAVVSSITSAPVHLYGGANTLTIIVTGADGITTKTYLVTATIDAPHIVVEQPAGSPLTFGSASADIGTAAPGASVSKVFTIRNAGTQNLTGLGINIDGANATEFTVTANPTAPLAAANTTSFTVTFTPTVDGTRTAALHIASNDPDEPTFDVGLTGHSHTVAFDHSSQTQVESAVTITVPVRLSSAFATAFTVPVTFAELHGQNDYTHSVSPLSFPIGKTVANVTLTLINDNMITGDRTVTLTLGQPSVAGVALGTPSVFTLTILEDDAVPLISSQPHSQIIVAGTPVTFTSGATGSPPLTLQWKKNNVAVPGATTSTLTFPAAALTDAGAYTFTATNHHPTATSSIAQLAVVDGTSAIIRTNAGTAPTMTVKAAGNLLTYRWQFHGSPLSTTNTSKYLGVTTKTLTVKTAAAADDGDYTCLVTAPGGSQVSGVFTLEVPTSKPVALTPLFPDSVAYNAYSYQLPYDTSASDAPTKFLCANLPSGLACNPLTGVVSGKPTAVGTFLVTVTLSNSMGPGTPVQANLVVSPFPTGAVGAYVGRMDRDSSVNGDLGGRVDLVTTSTGSFTGTLRLGASAYPLNSAMVTAPTAGAHPGVTLTVARGSLPAVVLSLDLDPVSFALIGSAQVVGGLTSASITGWRNTWRTTLPANPVTAQQGYHSFELEPDGGSVGLMSVPQGCGYATLTVSAAGVTTVNGHTSDGGTFTTSAVLGPHGEVLVFQLLYANKGSLLGSLAIASNVAHSISGALDWQKNAITTARDYKPFAIGAIAYGGLYAATLPVLGLPVQVADNAELTFGYGGLGGLTTNPDTTLHISALNAVVLPQPNPGKITSMTLTLSATAGTFSGKFTLTDGAVVRTVSFQGQLVSPLGKGYGYFLLPQLADPLAVPPTTSATSLILSGKVVLGAIPSRST